MLRMTACGAVAFLLATLTACAPAQESPAPASGLATTPAGPEVSVARLTLSGEVRFPEGTAVPEDARLILELYPEITADASADPLLRREILAAPGNVHPFTLELPAASLGDGPHRLSARLQSGYAILLASKRPVRITGPRDLTGIVLELADPEALVIGPAITPAGTPYVCGGERVILALEAGAAYITYPSGQSARLRRLETSGDEAEQFSNGLLLIERRLDENANEILALAQGDAMPQPCTEAG